MFSARRVPFGQIWTAATRNNVNPVTTCKSKFDACFTDTAVSPIPVQMNQAWRIKSAPISIVPKNLTSSYFSTSGYNHQAGYLIMLMSDDRNGKNWCPFLKVCLGTLNCFTFQQEAEVMPVIIKGNMRRATGQLAMDFKRTIISGAVYQIRPPCDPPCGSTSVLQPPEQVSILAIANGNPPEARVGHLQIGVRTLAKQPSSEKQMPKHSARRLFSYIQLRNLCSQVERFKWERPMVGCIKMNTDASLKKKDGENTLKAKGGIIFRDSNAKLVRGFYVILDGSTFENFDANLAEMMTIQRGLEKAIELGIPWVWAETDNKLASNKINKFKELRSETEEIAIGRSENEEIAKASDQTEEIAKAIWNLIEGHSIKFQITHIKNEGNGPAHCLVSRSFDHEFDFVDPHEISITFVKKLKNDESDVDRIRFRGAVNKEKIKKSK